MRLKSWKNRAGVFIRPLLARAKAPAVSSSLKKVVRWLAKATGIPCTTPLAMIGPWMVRSTCALTRVGGATPPAEEHVEANAREGGPSGVDPGSLDVDLHQDLGAVVTDLGAHHRDGVSGGRAVRVHAEPVAHAVGETKQHACKCLGPRSADLRRGRAAGRSRGGWSRRDR